MLDLQKFRFLYVTPMIRTMKIAVPHAFPPEEARHTGQRMFLFIRGYDELVGEDIEESDVFFHEDKCSVVEFDHEGCSSQSRGSEEAMYRWMRVVPFIVHGKV
ncbi:unnamed protein product [Nippostrongylus brasiliensis]|uniref:CdiI_N domain-containing protein n=1 Tax=Nippostrongylus brasiliensis TaxID=27835 RepID=A0A0N4XFL8_NIPBR|nr:unnamed protein product [Nippostrongylus brasiliensis]